MMEEPNTSVEYWLRGPVHGVPLLLQPVAHALLQAQSEIKELMRTFPEELLWEQPAGVASVGFHIQHITGVLDRLFTYAKGKPLSMQQLKYLSEEGLEDDRILITTIIKNMDEQVRRSIDYLKLTDLSALTDLRTVGRKQLASSVIGLLFHAAEHTMRHTGQLSVTARIMTNEE